MKIIVYAPKNAESLLSQLEVALPHGIKLVHCQSREDVASRAPDAAGFIAAGGGMPDSAMLEELPQLRWVQILSAGADKLPLADLRRRGIRLTNAKGVHQIQMSEFAMLQMLQWARRADLHFSNQLDKRWGRRVPSGELHGQTAGILGTGSIGQAIAAKAQAFGMRTLGYNTSGRTEPHFDGIFHGEDGLLSLLGESDYVVVIVPSTPDTQGLIGKEQLQAMKPSACLVNLARGTVVSEPELIAALQNGTIAGAALDVFEEEPLPAESPLWELPNVLITPHVAGASPRYNERAAHIVRENLRRLAENPDGPLHNEVDLSRGY
ncbi:D-2-hydroxyacid dehydrogenase [Paenibacillus sp. YN15]|uniref:D-2-hydroxyacid dehydrogenase n=1 Tax=Paenibacillus sp. YN15 TaxID=1742774 RepID=UPI000DCE059A|nr:D-2-hydroxyacid dehydrogenase [Paenibacillus sp. YN15]RAU99829.1 D-2-hydroxyacid dehydrogenase [Paenibacillus sp. YN15]